MYSSTGLNERPIIGITIQPVTKPTLRDDPQLPKTQVPASYVKLMECGGARVAPIKMNETQEYYERIFSSINGLIYPGGRVIVNGCFPEYTNSCSIMYDLAKEANSEGDYFPIWGTCLGCHFLCYKACGEVLQTPSNTSGVTLPLTFSKDAKDSRLFGNAPADVMEALASEPITAHAHKHSVSVETFNSNEKLRRFFKVLTTNSDPNGEIVSTIEARDYPFYGTVWHPEKSLFEWSGNISHSPTAVRSSLYLADFFINEARKSQHRFEDEEEERKALIHNYKPVYTGDRCVYQQMYFL